MEKPITIRHAEFLQSLEDLLNSSGLPAFVMAYDLSNAVKALNAVSTRQYADDKSRYETELKKQEKSE